MCIAIGASQPRREGERSHAQAWHTWHRQFLLGVSAREVQVLSGISEYSQDAKSCLGEKGHQQLGSVAGNSPGKGGMAWGVHAGGKLPSPSMGMPPNEVSRTTWKMILRCSVLHAQGKGAGEKEEKH